VEVNRGAGPLGDALDLGEQLVEEREAAQFPVGHDVQPAPFLERDRLVDGAVFNLLELLRFQPARVERGPGLEEMARAQ
jgi:hypothetical protein